MSSAIGRGFGLPLLEKLLPHEQVVPALSDLMRLDLIVEVSRRPAPEYRFRHGLVQEVAYNSLLEPARRSLHRRIGEAHRGALRRVGRLRLRPARPPLRRGRRARARRALLAARGRRGARRLRRPRGDRPLPPRARVPAAPRRSGRERDTLFKIALVRHLAFDYARAGQAYDAAFDCSAEERAERAPSLGADRARARAARFLRARRHVLERLGDRDRAALPRAPADRPRPQRRARARPEHERLGRRPDVSVHAARGRLLERRAPADGRRFRLRVAQAARGGARHGVPARRHRVRRGARRLDARGRTCASRATTSRTCSRRTGRTPGRATARTRSAPPGAGPSRSSATAPSCSPRSTRWARA